MSGSTVYLSGTILNGVIHFSQKLVLARIVILGSPFADRLEECVSLH